MGYANSKRNDKLVRRWRNMRHWKILSSRRRRDRRNFENPANRDRCVLAFRLDRALQRVVRPHKAGSNGCFAERNKHAVANDFTRAREHLDGDLEVF